MVLVRVLPLAALTFLRCGVNGPPVPYPLARPAMITNLTALARGRSISLSWTVPDKNRDGTALKDIKGFNVVRAAVPISAMGTKEVYEQWRYDYQAGARYMTVDNTSLIYGYRYTFLVLTVTQNDVVGDPSNPVVVYWGKPLMPVSRVRAQSGSHFIELSWAVPRAYVDGTKIHKTVYYNVYRGLTAGSFPLFPINPALISGTTYIDGGLENNVPYYYEVVSVSKVLDTAVESVPSTEILAVPVDLVSPARPYGISAAPVKTGIALSWEPNTESDILGYYVYRSSGNGRRFIRVNARPVSATTYVDTRARHGYNVYHVTAVDDSTQHNESAPSEDYGIMYRSMP